MASNTYVALDKVTVSGSSTSSITFNSIPQGYTDLIIQSVVKSASGTPSLYMYFNGSTASYYSATGIAGSGSAASSTRWANYAGTVNWVSAYNQGVSANNFNSGTVQIMNYSNTTTYKTSISRWAGADYEVDAIVGLWRGSTGSSTEAITSITLGLQSGINMIAGSTFSLYGVKAWTPEVAPKATGGYIYSDSTYWYHAFPYTSTFTPNQSLTCDYLMIAGGGGAAGCVGGAGGAGGLRQFSGQVLGTNTYTVTVGAGGVGGNSITTAGTQGGNSSIAGTGITTVTTTGGGYGGAYGGGSGQVGGNGGSGGGGSTTEGLGDKAGGSGNQGGYSPVEGYAGGTGASRSSSQAYNSGGGGGAGAAATNAVSGNQGQQSDGGIGATSALINTIGAATNTGQIYSGNYYYAGGGGGCGTLYYGTGGYGGGGQGGKSGSGNGVNGLVSSGGGGGAIRDDLVGGNGGSGYVVIRYAK